MASLYEVMLHGNLLLLLPLSLSFIDFFLYFLTAEVENWRAY